MERQTPLISCLLSGVFLLAWMLFDFDISFWVLANISINQSINPKSRRDLGPALKKGGFLPTLGDME